MKGKATIESNDKGSSRRSPRVSSSKSINRVVRLAKFSPSWVVLNAKDAPGYQMELIERIREGVKKADWKELIMNIGATEKEFELILPTSISSMQKKTVYSRETSERIYELARLFGLGYEVFDTKEDFRRWLITPSRALGNKKPFELLDSSFGFEMVENEIIRIQYNVYS
jgi:putative toxin-antitoxin system antitoxin component (TIGR02293 family)